MPQPNLASSQHGTPPILSVPHHILAVPHPNLDAPRISQACLTNSHIDSAKTPFILYISWSSLYAALKVISKCSAGEQG